ncbi:hypothetical protein, partial [Faecalicatena contorta]|uniref:hypothetical protein n=1 Tax=Faecalicatena contorta TaxID=39482 RepID=UPI001A9A555E
AVSHQEFLRFALSVFERTWMFSGRLSAIPSWSWRIQPAGKGSFLRRSLKRGQRMVLNWRDFYVPIKSSIFTGNKAI